MTLNRSLASEPPRARRSPARLVLSSLLALSSTLSAASGWALVTDGLATAYDGLGTLAIADASGGSLFDVRSGTYGFSSPLAISGVGAGAALLEDGDTFATYVRDATGDVHQISPPSGGFAVGARMNPATGATLYRDSARSWYAADQFGTSFPMVSPPSHINAPTAPAANGDVVGRGADGRLYLLRSGGWSEISVPTGFEDFTVAGTAPGSADFIAGYSLGRVALLTRQFDGTYAARDLGLSSSAFTVGGTNSAGDVLALSPTQTVLLDRNGATLETAASPAGYVFGAGAARIFMGDDTSYASFNVRGTFDAATFSFGTPAAVPEPAAFATVGLGLLALSRRRRAER